MCKEPLELKCCCLNLLVQWDAEIFDVDELAVVGTKDWLNNKEQEDKDQIVKVLNDKTKNYESDSQKY